MDLDLADILVRTPPEVSRKRLGKWSGIAEDEIVRLNNLPPDEVDPITGQVYPVFWREGGHWWFERPPIAAPEHLEIVMAEAWVAHWNEFCDCKTIGCEPFEGNVDAYLRTLVLNAAKDIHSFFSAGALAWRPKIPHSRGGSLHRAVEYLVKGRMI